MTRRQRQYDARGLALPMYRAGDIVRLRTGGPDMIVDSAQQGCLVSVKWIADGGLYQAAGFGEEALELVADAVDLGVWSLNRPKAVA